MSDAFDAPPREAIRPLSEGERSAIVRLLPTADTWDSLHILLSKEGHARDSESVRTLLMKEGERLYASLSPEDRQQLTHTNTLEVSYLAALLYTYTTPKITAFAAYGRANAFLHASTRTRGVTSTPEDTWAGWD